MTIPAQVQRALTSNALIIPTAIVVGGLFWVWSLWKKNHRDKEQV